MAWWVASAYAEFNVDFFLGVCGQKEDQQMEGVENSFPFIEPFGQSFKSSLINNPRMVTLLGPFFSQKDPNAHSAAWKD